MREGNVSSPSLQVSRRRLLADELWRLEQDLISFAILSPRTKLAFSVLYNSIGLLCFDLFFKRGVCLETQAARLNAKCSGLLASLFTMALPDDDKMRSFVKKGEQALHSALQEVALVLNFSGSSAHTAAERHCFVALGYGTAVGQKKTQDPLSVPLRSVAVALIDESGFPLETIRRMFLPLGCPCDVRACDFSW